MMAAGVTCEAVGVGVMVLQGKQNKTKQNKTGSWCEVVCVRVGVGRAPEMGVWGWSGSWSWGAGCTCTTRGGMCMTTSSYCTPVKWAVGRLELGIQHQIQIRAHVLLLQWVARPGLLSARGGGLGHGLFILAVFGQTAVLIGTTHQCHAFKAG